MKKYFSIGALALFSVLCLSVTLSSCDKDDKDKEGNNSIVGTWKYYGESEDGSLDNIIEDDENSTIAFLSDGTGVFSYDTERYGEIVTGRTNFKWSTNGNTMTITYEGYEDDPDSFMFKVENNKAYFYGDGVEIYNRVK